MADNFPVLDSTGTSKIIATKDIAGVHHKKVVLYDASGNAINVTNGGLDVNIQDQHTKIVNLRLHIDSKSVLLAADANIGAYVIDVPTGHGAVTGNLIYLEEGTNYYEGTCLNSTATQITLDTPLDNEFASGVATVGIGSPNLNVDGSSAVKIAHIEAPVGVTWDITRLMIYIEDNTAMDDSTFGGISRLTKGVVLRKKNGDYQNIFNCKSNGDFALEAFDATYQTAAPSGLYGFRVRRTFAGQEKNGVTIRLEPGDELEMLIQDNLAGLVRFYAVAQGHVVE